MAKGLCCQAQKNGDLGKPLQIQMVRKCDGKVITRCGVCEVGPSCRDPQKLVFQFRFLKGVDCNLATGKCMPTAAGVAQYNNERALAQQSGQVPEYVTYNTANSTYSFVPRPPAGAPYTLPSS